MEFLDPLHWFDERRRWRPRRLRIALSWVLLSLLAVLLLGVPFVSLGPVRDLITHTWSGLAWLPIFVLFGINGLILIVRRNKPAQEQPETTAETSIPVGGVCYLLIVVVMCCWWTLSTHVHELKKALNIPLLWNTATTHPTVLWQIALGGQALAAIIASQVIREPHLKRLNWLVSFGLFLLAQLLMVADTDLHQNQPLLWLQWRCWNYALVVPTLLSALLVVNGFRLTIITVPGLLFMVTLLASVLLDSTRVF